MTTEYIPPECCSGWNITVKLQPSSLARAYFRLVGCSYCCRLFIFFTNILKIIVFLFCSIKISRIFVKEITTKAKQNGNFINRTFKRTS